MRLLSKNNLSKLLRSTLGKEKIPESDEHKSQSIAFCLKCFGSFLVHSVCFSYFGCPLKSQSGNKLTCISVETMQMQGKCKKTKQNIGSFSLVVCSGD